MRNQFLFIDTCSGLSRSCPRRESGRARAPPGWRDIPRRVFWGGFSPVFVQVTTALLPQQLPHRHPTPLHSEAEAPDPTPAGSRGQGDLCPTRVPCGATAALPLALCVGFCWVFVL